MNILDLGMAYSGWELCARSVDDPQLLVVKDRDDPAPMRWIWYDPGFPDLPVKVIPYLVDPDESFPYGQDVEPD